MKDNVVTDYNQNMGFVDKNDQITTQHSIIRKCTKWTSEVAFHLIDKVILNAFILYKLPNQTP